jgi:hypothetical protein
LSWCTSSSKLFTQWSSQSGRGNRGRQRNTRWMICTVYYLLASHFLTPNMIWIYKMFFHTKPYFFSYKTNFILYNHQ